MPLLLLLNLPFGPTTEPISDAVHCFMTKRARGIRAEISVFLVGFSRSFQVGICVKHRIPAVQGQTGSG